VADDVYCLISKLLLTLNIIHCLCHLVFSCILWWISALMTLFFLGMERRLSEQDSGPVYLRVLCTADDICFNSVRVTLLAFTERYRQPHLWEVYVAPRN